MSNLTADNNPVAPYVGGPTLQIQVGEIDSPTEDAAYLDTDDDAADIFTDYMVTTDYVHDPHTYMLGITSPGGFQGASVAFCQLAAPTLLWVADWTACRGLTQPDIPDPNLNNQDWVFLGARMQPAMLTVAADGVTPIYRISGTYLYGKANPSLPMVKDIAYPLPPWLQDKFNRTMPQSKLQQNIIKPPGLVWVG